MSSAIPSGRVVKNGCEPIDKALDELPDYNREDELASHDAQARFDPEALDGAVDGGTGDGSAATQVQAMPRRAMATGDGVVADVGTADVGPGFPTARFVQQGGTERDIALDLRLRGATCFTLPRRAALPPCITTIRPSRRGLDIGVC